MKTQQELQQLGLDSGTLAQFTGTEKHHRISRRHLLTDWHQVLGGEGGLLLDDGRCGQPSQRDRH